MGKEEGKVWKGGRGERFESIQYGITRRVRIRDKIRTNSREERYKGRGLVPIPNQIPSKIISQCLPVVPVVLSSRTRNENESFLGVYIRTVRLIYSKRDNKW